MSAVGFAAFGWSVKSFGSSDSPAMIAESMRAFNVPPQSGVSRALDGIGRHPTVGVDTYSDPHDVTRPDQCR